MLNFLFKYMCRRGKLIFPSTLPSFSWGPCNKDNLERGKYINLFTVCFM